MRELQPKYGSSAKSKQAASSPPPAAVEAKSGVPDIGNGGNGNGLVAGFFSREPLQPKYDLNSGTRLDKSPPPTKKAKDGPGFWAKAAALGVVAVRQVNTMLAKKPEAKPTAPPAPDPRAESQALITLEQKYEGVPFTEVGFGGHAQNLRSHIRHTMRPSQWELEAKRIAGETLNEANETQRRRAEIRRARDAMTKLAQDTAAGKAISTKTWNSQSVPQGNPDTIIDALTQPIKGQLLVVATRGKWDKEGRSTIDDRIEVDPNKGLIIHNPSRGKKPEVRPWDQLGSGYELKVVIPMPLQAVNTALGQMQQGGLDIAGIGRVQIVDRQQNEVEVDVPMRDAVGFMKKVNEIKGTRSMASQPLPPPVAVLESSDLIPVPRRPEKFEEPPRPIESRTIFIVDPGEYKKSMDDTQPSARTTYDRFAREDPSGDDDNSGQLFAQMAGDL